MAENNDQNSADSSSPRIPPSTYWKIGIIVVLGFLTAIILLISLALWTGLVGVGNPNATTGNKVDCSGVASLTPEQYSWVKDAAAKYLSGDEAALVSLIQIESGWNVTAHNASSASGLGQFVDSSARGWPEFVGGDDKHGIVWPAGIIYDNPEPTVHPDDARYDAKRSIYASAHYLGGQIAKYGNLQDAYVKGYHGGTTPEQIAAAQSAGQKLMTNYNALKDGGGCKQTAAQLASSNVGCNNVPLFKQCDSQWGSDDYGCGGSTICSSGCGVTSAAMVLKFYGKNVTPTDMAKASLQGGFRVCNAGTAYGFFPYIAKQYGLQAKTGLTWEQGMEYLKQGKPVIVSGSGPAPFTSGGHFIVLTCYNSDGTIAVNDPAGSSLRDNKSYPESQIKADQHFVGIIYQ